MGLQETTNHSHPFYSQWNYSITQRSYQNRPSSLLFTIHWFSFIISLSHLWGYQGTTKLIRTHRLTDTVRHHAVKIAWLNEHYLNNNLKMANTKTTLMLVDCNTKPVNGSQLYNQISYVIGQRFYPPPSSQHFHDLQLDTYSWYQRQAYITKKTSSSTTDFSTSIPG
jgi:hypothetical protein